jgi:diacylglycerol kinase
MGKAIIHSTAFVRSRRVTTLSGHDRGFLSSRWYSFKAALAGVWYVLRTQPNAWIEVGALTLIGIAGWQLHIQVWEWGLLGLTVFVVLAMEAMNTAVESAVDLASPEYHPLAKIAKDAAAGAMIFTVLGSICVAAAIFGPRLWALFFGGPIG